MKSSISDYLFSPLVWIQIVLLFLLMTLLALLLTPLGPLLGAWTATTLVKELTIEGVSGSLLSQVNVGKLEWRDGDVTTLSNITLEPGQQDFSSDGIRIKTLNIESLQLALEEGTPARPRGEKVDIGDFGIDPLNLFIESGKLGQFLVTEGETNVFELSDVTLDGTEIVDNKISLKDVSAQMTMDPEPIGLTVSTFSMDMLEPHAMAVQANAEWQHPDIGKINADVVGGGFLQAYTLDIKGDIEHPDVGKQSFKALGNGDFDYIDITALNLDSDSGSMTATGELAWVPDVSIDLDVDAKSLNTAQFVPEWPAEITGKVKLKVALQQDKLRGALDIETLNGKVRGYPFSGSGQVSLLDDDFQFKNLQLVASGNRVNVNGQASEPFDLSWEIDAKNISKLALGVDGSVTANGTLTGSVANPILNGKLRANGLAFQGQRLESAQADIRTADGQYFLDGKLQGLRVNGERFSSATVVGRGDVDKHDIDLSINHAQAKLKASLEGAWLGQEWQGTLKSTNISDTAVGSWRLSKPAKLTVSAEGFSGDEICLESRDGKACSLANYSTQDGLKASGNLSGAPLQWINPFLPETLAVKGRVGGDYAVALNSELKGSANLQFQPGEVAVTQDGKVQRFAYRKGMLKAEIDGNTIDTETSFNLADDGLLSATAAVKLSPADGNHEINANGEFKAVPLQLAQTFLPEELGLSGKVGGNFNVIQNGSGRSGTVKINSTDVQLAYNDAEYGNQRYRFNQLAVDATLNGDNVVAEAQLALQDGGRFSGRAAVDLSKPDLLKSVTADGQFSAMPLALARPYLPSEIGVDGLISGEYSVRQEAGGTVGRVDVASNNGRFSYQPEGSSRQTYAYNSATVQATIQGDNVLADASLALKDGGALTTRLGVDLSAPNNATAITAEGNIKDMPMLLAQAFMPEGLTLNGRINGRYQIQQQGSTRGTVNLTFPAGSIRYDDGTNGAQTYEYRQAEVNAEINGDDVVADAQFILRDGGTFSGKGRLNLSRADNLYDFEGDGQLSALPLSLAEPYIPDGIRFSGVVNGSYQLSQRGGQQGQIKLTLPASSVSITDSSGKLQRFAYETSEVTAIVRGSAITADARLVLKDGGVLTSNANVTLGASMKEHRINVEGQLIAVPLALAAPYLSEDVSFPGKVNGNYTFAQVGGRQTGKVSLNLPNSYFSILTESGDQQPFPYENGLLNATIDGDRINIDTSLIFKNRGDLRASAQVTLQQAGSPLINGNLDINIPNIYWAQSYVPYSRGLRGEVVGKVSFNGTVANPRVVGRVDYRNGYLRLPQVGTELTDITLSIQTNRANEAVITGSMNSDGGIIRANGSMSLADIKNWSAKMSLVGENVKFVDTFEAKAYMTPNLQINAGPQAIIITGTVDIPKADINLKDLPELSIDESDDAIVIGEKGASDTINAVKVQPNILVRLGNDVRFKGFGFATRLSGSLRITNSRNTIVTNGSLFIIDGRYQAYGQDLKIDNGRLVFNGPPKNVGVDVKAVREVENGEVGIQLSGTLQRLTSTIFSNPVMEETDALSYLLTGHSLSTATGRETALLMQAVRGFGIDGSDGLIQRLGNSLGLDDLSIVTKEDFKDSELQLGKRLGSKLYVRYLVGLFDSAHRLAVDYKINKFLNLEMQVGEEQSVDLIYQIEMN